MSLYDRRGVSAQKEEVYAAVRHLDHGIYPNAFCNIYPDYLGNDDSYINISHSDGAGTKSILAYLSWKETGDVSVWKGIAQDAVVMNLDDLLCAGVYDRLLFSSTIDRNKNQIPGEVLSTILKGTQSFIEEMSTYGVNIFYLGGETADVGDIVRTIAVNGTMTARWKKEGLITNSEIRAGQVIVGFASFGQATYERAYNSGIGSNGLTSARHDVLGKYYSDKYHETFEPSLDKEILYVGHHKLEDKRFIDGKLYSIGDLLLSPTRTYAPLVKELINQFQANIFGMVHCSGGGQTKCMKYLPQPLRVIKDNLFPLPPVFQLIWEQTGASLAEMYQVFNMGHRLEIFTDEKHALKMIDVAKSFHIDATIVGHVEPSDKKELFLRGSFGEIVY